MAEINVYFRSYGFQIKRSEFEQIFNMLPISYKVYLTNHTLTHQPKKGPPNVVKLYRLISDYIIVPASTITYLRKYVKTNIYSSITTNDSKNNLDILHNNQKIIVDYLVKNIYYEKNIKRGLGVCTLNLRAGMGKTFVAAGLIARLCKNTKVLYVVPKIPLMIQTKADLEKCFGQNNNITVMVINSALKVDMIVTPYDMVILDEIHSYCSVARREIFWTLRAPIVLGLSATTSDRNDPFDAIYHHYLNSVINAEDIPLFSYENVSFKSNVDIIYYDGPENYTLNLKHESTGEIFTHYMYEQFMKDPYRLSVLLNNILTLYKEGHCVYVFAEEIAHLRKIEEKLRLADITGDLFTGGLKEKEINEIKINSNIILTTYGYAGTGVSISRATAIIFATPRKSNMKQILARILRRDGNIEITRRVIDIVDNQTALRHQIRKRIEAYQLYEMNIKHIKLDYTTITNV